MSIEAQGSPAPPPVPRPPSAPPSAPGPQLPFQRSFPAPPEAPSETTTRLRPIPAAPRPARTAAALTCLVLGLGLVAGAAAGNWLIGGRAEGPAAVDRFDAARALWHSTPVDTLFPRTIDGKGAGPGAADRTWKRLGVAPDGPCAGALDPQLAAALRGVGCVRVVRATYTDATASDVITVGLVVTGGDTAAMKALHDRFAARRLGDRNGFLPRPFAVPGTPAASFGDRQRASWSIDVLTDAPVLVFGVSGFADGRTVAAPEAADAATETGATSPAAQAGLGFEAKGVADRVERGLRGIADAGSVAR